MTEYWQGEYNDAVDGLFGPTPIDKHSATFRVAVLYDGTGELCQAIRDAGLEVVYTREPDSPTEDFDFDRVPAFDFLIANLPGSKPLDALQFALRFLRVRRPAAFVLVSEARVQKRFMDHFRGRAKQLVYQISDATFDGSNSRIIAVGTPPHIPFSWPCGDPVDASDANMLVMEVLERVGQSLLLQRT